jgi:branched-subunit amino acid aminotransferase/4-amino-4-deoxychorismate lyase
VTPPLSAGLLPGVTREYALDLAREIGVPAREERLTPADLARAAEVFITGTTREITPVRAIDDRAVGDGRPGPLTLRLLSAFRQRVGQPA